MLQLLLKKWWVYLIQGLLLIILSIYIFGNPETVLAVLSMWFGILVLLTGAVGIIAWLVTAKNQRGFAALFWSVLITIFGILILLNIGATMKTLTLIFGAWILVTSVHLIQAGWPYRKQSSMAWVVVITGILAAIVAVLVIFNMQSGAGLISFLLGIQILVTGIALVMLAFAKKAWLNDLKEEINANSQNS